MSRAMARSRPAPRDDLARPGWMTALQHAGVYLSFLGLAAVYTWPLATNLGGLLPPNGDPRLFSWVLLTIFGNLTTRPALLFHGNAFYPFGNTLSFAEPLLVPALVAGPWRRRELNDRLPVGARRAGGNSSRRSQGRSGPRPRSPEECEPRTSAWRRTPRHRRAGTACPTLRGGLESPGGGEPRAGSCHASCRGGVAAGRNDQGLRARGPGALESRSFDGTEEWWRRWELNPRPKTVRPSPLHP